MKTPRLAALALLAALAAPAFAGGDGFEADLHAMDKRGPGDVEPAVPVPERTEASRRYQAFAWNGAGTSVALTEEPAIELGVTVTYQDPKKRSRLLTVNTQDLSYVPSKKTLLVTADLGLPAGYPMAAYFESKAEADRLRAEFPGLKTMRARYFLDQHRPDKAMTYFCRVVGRGAGPDGTGGRRLEVTWRQNGVGGSEPTNYFYAQHEDLDALQAQLDAWHGCSAREFPPEPQRDERIP